MARANFVNFRTQRANAPARSRYLYTPFLHTDGSRPLRYLYTCVHSRPHPRSLAKSVPAGLEGARHEQ